jgi:hypothetical protein
MLKIVSAAVQYITPPTERYRPETERQNPDQPISFFDWNGITLYISDATASDSHTQLFQLSHGDILASGRVNKQAKRGGMTLHPDLMTVSKMNALMNELLSVYPGVQWKAEYQGEYTSLQEIMEQLPESAFD